MHVDSIGSGAPLLLIHGWGMHGGVWSEVAQKLAADFRVHSVDLPGYGYSKAEKEMTLDAIVDELSACFPEPLNVCGWSMGGQVALRWAAREPDKVQRLILVTSTPCFTKREDWDFGMDSEVLEKFADELEQNHAVHVTAFHRTAVARQRERARIAGTDARALVQSRRTGYWRFARWIEYPARCRSAR